MAKRILSEEEIAYLENLSCIDGIEDDRISWNAAFKAHVRMRLAKGDSPSVIFREAGCGPEIIGAKRIERACARWKEAKIGKAIPSREAEIVCTFCRERTHCGAKDAYNKKLSALKERLEYQAELKRRAREKRWHDVSRLKKASAAKEKRIIANQRREIERLRSEVKALKANGTLAKTSKRAPNQTSTSERFETIWHLRSVDPTLNISAACAALEVSRRGYYDWVAAFDKRNERDIQDQIAKEQIEQAFYAHGFKKGSRLIREELIREQGIVMNRKRIQRIMRKYNIVCPHKRKRPYYPIGQDGEPKIAENILKRDFHPGCLRKIILTDITYIRCKEGFAYMSAVIDSQSNELLAHELSLSLEMPFVLRTFDKLKGINFLKGAISHSDRGIHYMAQSYREKLKELGLVQSMSAKGCCHDNAAMESWFGRMKEQVGQTDEMTFCELSDCIDRYVHYYNYHRAQKRLGWQTPKEYATHLAA